MAPLENLKGAGLYVFLCHKRFDHLKDEIPGLGYVVNKLSPKDGVVGTPDPSMALFFWVINGDYQLFFGGKRNSSQETTIQIRLEKCGVFLRQFLEEN